MKRFCNAFWPGGNAVPGRTTLTGPVDGSAVDGFADAGSGLKGGPKARSKRFSRPGGNAVPGCTTLTGPVDGSAVDGSADAGSGLKGGPKARSNTFCMRVDILTDPGSGLEGVPKARSKTFWPGNAFVVKTSKALPARIVGWPHGRVGAGVCDLLLTGDLTLLGEPRPDVWNLLPPEPLSGREKALRRRLVLVFLDEGSRLPSWLTLTGVEVDRGMVLVRLDGDSDSHRGSVGVRFSCVCRSSRLFNSASGSVAMLIVDR